MGAGNSNLITASCKPCLPTPRLVGSELLRALQDGDCEAGRAALDRGGRVHDTDEQGWTALHHAVRHDDLDFAAMLLAAGADLAAQNNEESTPMMLCQSAQMRELLQTSTRSSWAELIGGARATLPPRPTTPGGTVLPTDEGDTLPTDEGDTPSRYSPPPRDRALEAAREAAAKKAKLQEALWQHSSSGNAAAVTAALEEGAEVDKFDGGGQSALHYAAAGGHLPVAQVLVTAGAAGDACAAPKFRHPLHEAAHGGHLELITFLLEEAFADVDARAAEGLTPLHAACRAGQVEASELLMERGADKGAKDAKGRTPAALLQAALRKDGSLTPIPEAMYSRSRSRSPSPQPQRRSSSPLPARFSKIRD